MRVSILGNPGITKKVDFLSWMYNWKWMNLSKMPGLNRKQNNSNKNEQLKLYHRMKPSFENEKIINHFFLKADQHCADYGN